jgi:HTH-type transcriptional regulator/antitoxin MqsA
MCICNKCQSNNVTQSSEVEEYTYKNSKYDIEIEYSLCNSCNREFISKNQIIANEARARESKKQIDGLLSLSDIKKIRDALNLTQTDASIIFGGGRNAFSKYERSEVTQSAPMDKLLRLASTDRYIFRKLVNLSDIKNKFNFGEPVTLKNIPSMQKPKTKVLKNTYSNSSLNYSEYDEFSEKQVA